MTTSSGTITLHHADKSKRLLWLLEELKLPYEIRQGGPKIGSLSSSGRAATNPVGNVNGDGAVGQQQQQQQQTSEQSSIYNTIAQAVASSLSGALPPTHSPAIVDGGVTVRESGAIVEYLIEKYGSKQFTPRTSSSKLDNTFFMHYAEGSFMPPLVLKQVFSTILEKSPFFVRPFTSIVVNQICQSFIDPANFNNFSLVDCYLMKDGGRTFLAGGNNPTGGDFMMSFPIESAVTCGAFKSEEIPKSMRDYLDRLQARPAYAKVEALLKKQSEVRG